VTLRARSSWVAGAFFVATLVATAVVLAAAGFDVRLAASAMVSGAFGSWYAFGSATLVRATPLILAGLGVGIAFRAGVFNIGAEGQFLVGAAAAAAAALSLRTAPAFATVPLSLAAGVVAGTFWAGIAAVLRARFRVLEVISTILLNFVAINLVSYLVRGPLQEPSRIYPQTPPIPDSAQLPRLGEGTRLHVGFLVAVAACAVCWWVLRFTASGFRLRIAGASPNAARVAALIDVPRVTTLAFLASGGLAGLAGAIEVTGVTFALYENLSPGYGYTAIAVALLARLNAAGILLTGGIFGALEAGATAMQREAGVPSVVVSVIEAAIILALVALSRARAAGAAARPR
jgi:general nucleoside transport system permease protein